MMFLQIRTLDLLKVTTVLLVAATALLPTEQLHAQAQAARIRSMADKAYNFLSTQDLTVMPNMREAGETNEGGKFLVALTIYKYHKIFKVPGGNNHPKVVAGKNLARDLVANSEFDRMQNYELGLAIILLAESEADAYRPQIQALIDVAQRRQREDGAWNYYNAEEGNGDVSISQYLVLALWTAKQYGFDIDELTVENACKWLLRTQDNGGGWPYTPVDPGNFGPTNQNSKQLGYDQPSDAAAGLGSLYISAGLLGFVNQKLPQKTDDANTQKTNGVLQIKKEESEEEKITKNPNIPEQVVMRGLNTGNGYFSKKGDTVWDTQRWPYYFIYSYERYMTFRELAELKNIEEPAWFVKGVYFLEDKQMEDGSWVYSSKSGKGVDTCLAMLFLLRSTKQSLKLAIEETKFQGGVGLPKNLANAKMKDGKVVAEEVSGDIESILQMLESEDGLTADTVKALPPDITLSGDAIKRREQQEQLKALISEGNYLARRVAVRSLAREQKLEAVPTLLFAMTDPNKNVVREARDALRFISRRLDGFGLKDNFTEEERNKAVQAWRNWYLQVRPEAELEE